MGKLLFILSVFCGIVTNTYTLGIKANMEFSKDGVRVDTITKDIPLATNGKISYLYLEKKKVETKGDLDNLENGVDLFTIRVWFNYVFDKRKQVIQLSKSGHGWSGRQFELTTNYYGNTDSILSVAKDVKSITPKMGWDSFIKRAFDLKILTLPRDKLIPNYQLENDGDYLSVEIASKSSYRFYSYSNSALNSIAIWQARNVVQFVDLMESEFDFKRLDNW